jgi:carboxypeptidase Taq
LRYNSLLIGPILTLAVLVITMGASCQVQGQGSPGQNVTPGMTPREAYDRLLNISTEMAHIDMMMSLSYWDQDISMPQDATECRAGAHSYLADLKNKKVTDPEFGRLLSIAGDGSNWSLTEASNLKLWNRDYSKRIKLPSDFASRESKAATLSQAAWEEAREKDNYSIFKPHLRVMIELGKEKARCWGYGEHPYDALLDDCAPGMSVAKYDKLFDSIKPGITELIKEINESNQTGKKDIYGNASYPAALEEEICRNMTAALGFDYGSGMMSATKRHPSTYPIGVHDTRTTVRCNEKKPEDAILDALHEGGHGIAFQNIPDRYFGMPIGSCPDMGIAEAESRLFENNFGRSRAFWQYWLPQLKYEFRPSMDDVTLNDMYLHINRLNLSPVRLDADEISYIIHIIIRYEIERDLFDGKIGIDDLPGVWSQKYRDYLGVNITSDKEGILQDIHWADGGFGYFPAYALGSLNAAQLEAAMRRDHPDLEERFASGDFSVPAAWMKEHVYQYGAIYDAPELMKMATGNETEAYDFLNYLDNKYKTIYNLN